MLEVLALPLLACLVLTGIHVYLGLHVLARGVIFVDLALAQVAALGMAVAFLAGHPIQSDAAYWYALAFTAGGAAVFAISRFHHAPIPQEAIIGIVYAVSAAAAVLVVDRAPQGIEHIKQLLVGSLLTVTGAEVVQLAALYGMIGLLHVGMRRPLLQISLDPAGAAARGRAVRWWDFCFYLTFGLVVTSSVRIAGVLLVFSYLVVPAVIAALLAGTVARRLAVGWLVGAGVSLGGLLVSYAWDLPTGAAVVTAFGALLALVALALGARTVFARARQHGWRALRGVGAGVALLGALAGLLLLLFPRMDHHWLDWMEEAAPAVQRAFLTPFERRTRDESRQAIARARVELERLRRIHQDVQWGTRSMPEEQQERLRQFLASRSEIAAGDRLVLDTLRRKARERQRIWLGAPLLALGAGGALALWRAGRRAPAGRA